MTPSPTGQTVAWADRAAHSLTGWWRGLGLLPNTFAVECFMDEVAAAAGVDPIKLRLRHLPEGRIGERLAGVLRAAADRAGWNSPSPAGRARGVACCADYSTVVAAVAEVSVEGGQVRFPRSPSPSIRASSSTRTASPRRWRAT